MHNNLNTEVTPITESPARRPPSGNAKMWAVIAIVVILVVFLAGFVPRHQRNQKITDEARQRRNTPPTVEVAPVRRSTFDSGLTLPGTISAIVEAPIYARASGYVAKRNVDIGDHVQAGQLLATIDAPDLDQQVDQARSALQQSSSVLGQAEAQLDLATATWNRDKVLVEQGVLSRQDGDIQRAAYEVGKANVRAAQQNVSASQANLDRLVKLQQYERVTAPFTGIVTARNIDVGTLISASGGGLGNSFPGASPATAQGGEMFRVARSDRVRVFIAVPEASVPGVKTREQAEVHVDSLPAEQFTGKVTRTANAIDPATRTLLTEVQIDNRDSKLLPGMFATISFKSVRAAPPLIVPSDSLITRGEGTMVAVVRDNVVHLLNVRVGRDYGAQTEIVQGLNDADQVVLNPSDAARENVRVVARQAATPGGNNSQPRQGSTEQRNEGGKRQ